MRSDRPLVDFLKSRFPVRAAIAVAVGALILICALFFEGSADKPSADEESRVQEMCCAMQGVSDCTVMLTYSDDGRVASVAVVYYGDTGKQTEREIKEMLGSLYGIGANRIAVVAQKNN